MNDTLAMQLPIELPTQRGAFAVLVLVTIIVVGIAMILWMLIRNRTELKAFMNEFPTHGGTVVVALTLIFFTGLVVIVRLALGAKFPDNYETWIWALVALAGVTTAGLGIKRMTDYGYVERKAAGPSPVNVQAPSTVEVRNEEG